MPMRWVARGALTLLTLLSPRDATIGTPSMALVSIGDSAGSVATSSTLLAAAAEAAVGIEYVWVGGRGYWSDASNWSPAGVPGINDTAVIKAFKGQDANMNAEYNTSIWLGAPPASPPILNISWRCNFPRGLYLSQRFLSSVDLCLLTTISHEYMVIECVECR